MAHAYRPLEEGEVFNTFHDMVHAAILSAGTGAATLKEIYAACIQFGRVKCRRTGGWRLVTDRRNWKSHIRHTLYTTEKFLRCPHDTEAWMLAPDYSHTLPQTTRHYLGYRVGETFDAPLKSRAGRHAQTFSSAPRNRAMPSAAGDQHDRLADWQESASCRALPAYRTGSPHGLPPSTDEDEDDADPYDEEDDHPEPGREPSIQPLQELQEPQHDVQPFRHVRRGPRPAQHRHAVAAMRVPVPKHLAGSKGGRAARVLALLPGSAAAAAAAAAAAGDEELDWEDEGTLTALFAAQEVLNNPTAARILLLLLQQRQQQLQHPPAAGFPGRRHRARPVYEPIYQQQHGHDEYEVDKRQGKAAREDTLEDEEDEDEAEGLRGLCGLAAGSCRRGGPTAGTEQRFMADGSMSGEDPIEQPSRPRSGAAAARADAHPMRNTTRGESVGASGLASWSRPHAPELPGGRVIPPGAAVHRRQGVSARSCGAQTGAGTLHLPATHAGLSGSARSGEHEDVRHSGPHEEAGPRDRDSYADQQIESRRRGGMPLRGLCDGGPDSLEPYLGTNSPGTMASSDLRTEGINVPVSGGNMCPSGLSPPLPSTSHQQHLPPDIGTDEAVLGLSGAKAGTSARLVRESSEGPIRSTLGKRCATDSNNSSSFVADLGDELQQQQHCLEDQHARSHKQHGGMDGQARKRLCASELSVVRVVESEAA